MGSLPTAPEDISTIGYRLRELFDDNVTAKIIRTAELGLKDNVSVAKTQALARKS